jgi:hypothetical protein
MRKAAVVGLTLLMPFLGAPSCTRGQQELPDADSKRAIRKGVIGGLLVVNDGQKALPAFRGSCVYVGVGGIRDPETGETARCSESPQEAPTVSLDIRPGERFRVLQRGAGAMEIYGLHRLEPSPTPCPGPQRPLQRREGQGKARWDFRLPAAGGLAGIRIAEYGTSQVSCHDLRLQSD